MKNDLLRIQVDQAAVHAAIKAARRMAALFDAAEFAAADILWSEDGPRPVLVRLLQEFNNGGQVHEREIVRKLLESLHPNSPNRSHGQIVRDCVDAMTELIPEAEPPPTATEPKRKGRGGRARKWQVLYNLMCSAEMEGKTDEAIAASYRQRYSTRQETARVDAPKVREVRANYRRREQNHE